MTKHLITAVSKEFNGEITTNDTVKFSFGEDDYCLTDGTLYAVVDGEFLPGCKKVKTLTAVKKFVEARA